MSDHQHEAWQIRESAKGGYYCAACGDKVMQVGGFHVVASPVVSL